MNDLSDFLLQYRDDPYKFVMANFPWGEPGTPLADADGPDDWQKDFLNYIRDEIAKRHKGDAASAIRAAVSSGHGVGKSALTSWLIIWFMSTRPNPQCVITANTASQLDTKTWRELAKWHKLALNADWFEWTATKFYLKEEPETWFTAAITWNESRPEAFQGIHEKNVLVIFDEASGIPDVIWEVIEGAMTTEGAMWFAFGNPSKNTGRFRECFRNFSHRWKQFKVDSRESRLASKAIIDQWLVDYGEDSDFFKVRVRGDFPSKSFKQVIPTDAVDAAIKYRAEGYANMPYVMGVDVGRERDMTVITVRQGRKVHLMKKYNGLTSFPIAHKIYELMTGFPNITIFIDAIGIGAGVVDACRQLKMNVIPIISGKQAENKDKYRNKRAEMWDRMRQWIEEGAEIPNDKDLYNELISMEGDWDDKGIFYLMSKDELKLEGHFSPDCADSLALTFASFVAQNNKHLYNNVQRANTDWAVF